MIVGDGEGLSLMDFVDFLRQCGGLHTDFIDLTDFLVAVSFIAHRFHRFLAAVVKFNTDFHGWCEEFICAICVR